ncbi:hypothetical protein A7W90_12235 [Clostridium sp. Bc-iso-3]|nr:hypothetical protein A7W90_12235 [Clostridium sp. Bc-iso-3]
MSQSIYRTIKLIIFVNIFLIPFTVAIENIIIRLAIGLFSGFSFIVLLSFIHKLQNTCKKG